MKNQLKAALLGLFVAGSVQAITISDNNPANVWINALNPSYTGNFTPAPYNPGTEQITSAFVEFDLLDVFGGRESYTLTLDGGAFASGGSFAGAFSFGGGVFGSALVTLSDTGALSYTISRTSGEFFLENAYLQAEKTDRPQGASGVPDHGSSVLMLVGGLLALGALRRGRFVA